ncbi:MAG: carboxypeptidase regulatory-like domain-containing protein [Longimicrobiales bacterium]
MSLRHRAAASAAGVLLVAVSGAAALTAQDGVPVSGMIYDSINGRPLVGATVVALGTDARTRTDARGQFTFDLPAGQWDLSFTHPGVADWAPLLHERGVTVQNGPVAASMATASESTVLGRTCGAGGAVVGGVVRDMLTRVPVARAMVEVTGRIGGREEDLGRIPTDLDGSFQLCVGALPDDGVTLRASIGGTRSRPVGLETHGRRVVATDLNVVVSQPARISGVLTDGGSTEPVADALIRVDGTRLGARSGPDGRFLIRGVPPGAVLLAVEHVRYGRRSTEVLAESGDSVHVEFELHEEAIALEGMEVRVTRAATDRRDRMGTRFDGLDRADIERLLERSNEFVDMMRNANIPGLHLFHDGRQVCVEVSRRTGAFANQCQMVDVYVNDVRIMDAREFLTTIPPESIDRVQVVSPLEAVGRFGGRAVRFGALLIYTMGN